MNRNRFLKNLALGTAVGTFLPQSLFSAKWPGNTAGILPKIGIQLFSVPKLLEEDFQGTVEFLAKMGYSEIEMFGPYPFSADAGKQRWKAVTSQLGFSGSGFFGHSLAEVKSIFDANSFTVPSLHTDLDTLETKMKELGAAGQTLGTTYVVLPAIPDERRKTLDDYKKMADTFNSIGGQAKDVGVKFAYHNHGYGLSEMEGQIPLQLLLEHTDPELVFLEMDLFWTISGKADPIQYLKKYSGRYKAMHVKDMKEKKTFSGDGGDAGQWIPLFPNMTSAGSGVVELDKIIPLALENGVEHFFVEQDMVADPQIALKNSIDYLRTL